MNRVVVVPCFNEAERLDGRRLLESALATRSARILFVDDGSTDATAERLDALCRAYPDRAAWMRLERNSGKCEAVRRGLLRAIDEGAEVVGYLDADLSAPPEELARILDELDASAADVAMGARVALLGRRIERRLARHLLGRVFATVSSTVLGLPVYDTQCGAKAFRVTPALRDALAEPFLSRWAFDVELIGRLLRPRRGVAPTPLDAVIEVPLYEWIHKAGSKLTPFAMVRSAAELGRIGLALQKRPPMPERRGR